MVIHPLIFKDSIECLLRDVTLSTYQV